MRLVTYDVRLNPADVLALREIARKWAYERGRDDITWASLLRIAVSKFIKAETPARPPQPVSRKSQHAS